MDINTNNKAKREYISEYQLDDETIEEYNQQDEKNKKEELELLEEKNNEILSCIHKIIVDYIEENAIPIAEYLTEEDIFNFFEKI